jgi:hypothetical protein
MSPPVFLQKKWIDLDANGGSGASRLVLDPLPW